MVHKKGVKNIINAGIKGQISLATDEKDLWARLNDGCYKENRSDDEYVHSAIRTVVHPIVL